MANKFPEHKPDPCDAPAEAFRHVRKNPVTGKPEYFYPMEITDPSIRACARAKGMEITGTRLGNRVIEAVMVPCRESGTHRGLEVPADTPPEAQRRLYLACISDELREQDARRRNGRCLIPDGRGGLKRCRPRTPNPEYTPGSGLPKTLPVRCEGCQYEQFRQAHTTIVVSALDHENEAGEFESFEIPAKKDLLAADRFLELREEFIAFVSERNPKLVPLAELLTLEFTKSEAARELGDAWGTVTSLTDKLKELVTDFLDTIVTP